MFEKLWLGDLCTILICLEVEVEMSRAIIKPKMVTISAAIFKYRGIDKVGVFTGFTFSKMIKPAQMLPHARRFKGLITEGLFSLMGQRGANRGLPKATKKISRRL